MPMTSLICLICMHCWICWSSSRHHPYKENVIKKATSLPWILGDIPRLVELHELGVLTDESLDEVLMDWEKVSDIPVDIVAKIAHGNYDRYHDLSSLRIINDHTTELIIQLTTMMQAGKFTKEQVPLEDITGCVYAQIAESGKYSDEVLRILKGSVEDLRQYMLKEDSDLEEMSRAMQILISFLLLMNQ